MAELSQFLARRGHEVTVLSTSPHRREEELVDGVRIVREREISCGWAGRLNLVRPETGFALVCRRFLDDHSFDVLHCLHHVDALGAMWSERSRRTPCVYHMTGIPFGKWIRRHPWETAVTKAVIRHASRVLVVSSYAGRMYDATFGSARPARALGIPCNLSAFRFAGTPDPERPIILFMGALTEERKGALPLARAFNAVRSEFPRARLHYCGDSPAVVRDAILSAVAPEARADVQFLGKGRVEDLPRIYAEASVTVLPAVAEAFGMVLVQSGRRHARGRKQRCGMTDIVEPGVGRLFDPEPVRGVAANVAGLARTICETLSLHKQPDLAARCRRSAKRFSWDHLGPEYEQVYLQCVRREGIAA